MLLPCSPCAEKELTGEGESEQGRKEQEKEQTHIEMEWPEKIWQKEHLDKGE